MLNLDKNQKYLLACSHGPDSMALFFMLKEEGYKFAVAHVNYHLREESDEEQKELEDYCAKNNVELYIKEVNESLGENNLEEQCRIIRYTFFKELVNKYHFYAVLIAHNQDDVIETYLMQKTRQNLVEFFGIKENPIIFDTKIIRPVLGFTKQELLMFCDINKVEYSIDKTNLQDVFLRNKIRHQVVEKMSKEERNKILEEMALENEKLAKIQEKISQMKTKTIEEYNRLSDDEFLYAIVRLGRTLKPNFAMSRAQGLEIRKIFKSDKANISVDISGLKLVKSYDSFDLIKDDDKQDFSYEIKAPTMLDTEYFYLDFTGDTSNRNVTLHDYPLTIRNAKPEDTYLISGYAKQLRRLFIDWKVPLPLRKRWPVIVNKDGIIIYVPRYQKNFKKEDDCNFYVK
jgi:tRNA(Ile)-lysidine synthase